MNLKNAEWALEADKKRKDEAHAREKEFEEQKHQHRLTEIKTKSKLELKSKIIFAIVGSVLTLINGFTSYLSSEATLVVGGVSLLGIWGWILKEKNKGDKQNE